MSNKIKKLLAERYPEHSDFFLGQQTIAQLTSRPIPLPEGVVRVVAGQMLSGAAAQTIYGRIAAARDAHQLPGSWLLSHDTLRQCGLSNAKAKTIVDFGATIGREPSALDHWKTLDPEELHQAICSYKGMGDWTAGIIALFYVGHDDIFPIGDGSLQRAMQILTLRARKQKRNYTFNPDLSRPYRSYLALYLWQGLDTGTLA